MKQVGYDEVKRDKTAVTSNWVIKPKDYYDINVYTKNHKKACLYITFGLDNNTNISVSCYDGNNGKPLGSETINSDKKLYTGTIYCMTFDTCKCEYFKFRITNEDESEDVIINKFETGLI